MSVNISLGATTLLGSFQFNLRPKQNKTLHIQIFRQNGVIDVHIVQKILKKC